MKKYIIYLFLFVIFFVSCKKDVQIEARTPKVVEEAVGVSYTEVTFDWKVEYPGMICSVVRLGSKADLSDAVRYGDDKPSTDKVFSVKVPALDDGKEYYYCYEIWNPDLKLSTDVKRFSTKLITPPLVTTLSPTDVTGTSATFGGDVTDHCGATVTERGVCWGSAEDPAITDSHLTDSTAGTGSFTLSVTGLNPGETYHVKAYAINSQGISYGEDMMFNTGVLSPTVITTTPTDVTTNSATCGGNVTSSGGVTVTERGICWGPSHNPTTSGSHASNGTGTGTFSINMTGLTPNTTYYVRAYAKNTVGTSYGTEVSFTTSPSISTVATNQVTNITQTTATGSGNVTSSGGVSVTERGICWSTSHNPTTNGSHANSGTGTGTFTVNMTGLTANTTYYVKAYAKNSVGTSYGDEVSFTTLELPSYSIAVSANPNNGGNVTGGGTYQQGQSCTVTATANTGYTFLRWTENGTQVSTNSSYTFTVSGNRTLVGNFAQAPVGAINGLFSVSATQQVCFSQGNLQYIGSSNTWKFADHQWDVIGTSQGSSSQSTTRDLFGWGTSGYNHGAICYQPWSTSTSNSDYYAYGSSSYNLYDQSGKADWGYNAIANGGNTENNGWRTLTRTEWVYVFNTRSTPSGIRYAKAKVNNVNGVILLPDNWNSSYYTLSNTNQGGASYTSNTISSSQWNTLEQHGVVFLPAAGGRDGTSVDGVDSHGYYWSASYGYTLGAWRVYFYDSYLGTDSDDYRSRGRSVRLVRSAQ